MAFIKGGKQQVSGVIDYPAVRRAAKILGLQHEVRVTHWPDEDGWWGQHEPLHVVSYTRCVPNKDISHVLWHELGHAMQCERDYDSNPAYYLCSTYAIYAEFTDDAGNPKVLRGQPGFEEWKQKYYQIPMEAEAEDIAVQYAGKHPLIK